MDVQGQVRERREEQEKTSYDRPHPSPASPIHVPDGEDPDYYFEGQPLEDFNFLETHINTDVDWPLWKDTNH